MCTTGLSGFGEKPRTWLGGHWPAIERVAEALFAPAAALRVRASGRSDCRPPHAVSSRSSHHDRRRTSHWIGQATWQSSFLGAFASRIFLAENKGEGLGLPTPGTKSTPESFLTNWDTLGALINKFNGALSQAEYSLLSVLMQASFRSATLSHTAACARPSAGFPLTMWRFGKAERWNGAGRAGRGTHPNWFEQHRSSALGQ